MQEGSRKVQQRTCIGCGTTTGKGELVRLVALDGKVEVDARAARRGRGAYVCSPRCAEKATARKLWGRAFKRSVEAKEELAEEVARAQSERGADGALDNQTSKPFAG